MAKVKEEPQTKLEDLVIEDPKTQEMFKTWHTSDIAYKEFTDNAANARVLTKEKELKEARKNHSDRITFELFEEYREHLVAGGTIRCLGYITTGSLTPPGHRDFDTSEQKRTKIDAPSAVPSK